jgi:hypothetical protein
MKKLGIIKKCKNSWDESTSIIIFQTSYKNDDSKNSNAATIA